MTQPLQVPTSIPTGDPTYPARAERFNYIMKRLGDTPKPTYQQIADELHISKPNVGRYVTRGTVRPSGQPRNTEARLRKLRERLTYWQAQGFKRIADGKEATREVAWVVKIEAAIKELAG